MEEMLVWAICWKTEDLVLVQVKFGNMHKMRCQCRNCLAAL